LVLGRAAYARRASESGSLCTPPPTIVEENLPSSVLPLRSVTIALPTIALLALLLPLTGAASDAEWTPFAEDSDAVCANGSEVNYLERRADPTRVVLYFEGGGACFSAATCDFDGPQKSYVSSSLATPGFLEERGGIFDLDRPENPLADHSFVYVPYCTGDVHLGNAATDYGPDLVVEHRGYPNGLVALDHLVETYPQVQELLVTGTSAGSVPTPLFAGLAADRLPEARIVTLGDGSGAYPDDPVLNGLIGSLWGTEQALPDWPEVDGATVRDWGIPRLYRYAGRHAPEITFAKFDHAFDETQAFYAELVGVDADELVALIDENEAVIEAEGVEVASYVAPGSDHTILGRDTFYELEVEGVRFVDWVADLVRGETPPDVHCRDCR
jgi:ABC-type proline/glycine betaine transport system permease subunit